ncbi:MAG: hypothetical protein GY813_07340 [Halieaceae bacterium]|nr:hypothetical protein [Halieaceae bacterium]
MLELRQAKWVARREKAGPKTIEQIHKDAAMDAMKKSLEPVIRTYSGRGSAEAGRGSREASQGRDSREGSYVGRHSNAEGRRGVPAVPEAEAVSNLRGAADTAAEVLEQKTKAILEEYFGLGDMAEAYLCLTELYHPDTITSYVENMFNCVVERSSKDRGAAGRLLAHLMEKDSLSKSVFQAGLVGILEVAEDLAIDIPKFWQYLAQVGVLQIEFSLFSKWYLS